MVIAYHLIFTAYGFWLPNEPRGSWSDFVRAWELLLKGGPATKTNERRSVARRKHDRAKRLAAKSALKYPPVEFTGKQARAIAHGFVKASEESGYIIVACSIMPTHVHLVVMRHERLAERIIGHLKSRATQALVDEALHPFLEVKNAKGRFPSVWADRGWQVFLFNDEDIRRAIGYVAQNRRKDGLPRQMWSFVREYPLDTPRKRGR